MGNIEGQWPPREGWNPHRGGALARPAPVPAGEARVMPPAEVPGIGRAAGQQSPRLIIPPRGYVPKEESRGREAPRSWGRSSGSARAAGENGGGRSRAQTREALAPSRIQSQRQGSQVERRAGGTPAWARGAVDLAQGRQRGAGWFDADTQSQGRQRGSGVQSQQAPWQGKGWGDTDPQVQTQGRALWQGQGWGAGNQDARARPQQQASWQGQGWHEGARGWGDPDTSIRGQGSSFGLPGEGRARVQGRQAIEEGDLGLVGRAQSHPKAGWFESGAPWGKGWFSPGEAQGPAPWQGEHWLAGAPGWAQSERKSQEDTRPWILRSGERTRGAVSLDRTDERVPLDQSAAADIGRAIVWLAGGVASGIARVMRREKGIITAGMSEAEFTEQVGRSAEQEVAVFTYKPDKPTILTGVRRSPEAAPALDLPRTTVERDSGAGVQIQVRIREDGRQVFVPVARTKGQEPSEAESQFNIHGLENVLAAIHQRSQGKALPPRPPGKEPPGEALPQPEGEGFSDTPRGRAIRAYLDLRRKIHLGEIANGTVLPRNALAQMGGFNSILMEIILEALESEGLVERTRGVQTTVSQRRNVKYSKIASVAQSFREQIQEGLLEIGTTLPGMRELENSQNITRARVQAIYFILEAEGLATSLGYYGTYVGTAAQLMEIGHLTTNEGISFHLPTVRKEQQLVRMRGATLQTRVRELYAATKEFNIRGTPDEDSRVIAMLLPQSSPQAAKTMSEGQVRIATTEMPKDLPVNPAFQALYSRFDYVVRALNRRYANVDASVIHDAAQQAYLEILAAWEAYTTPPTIQVVVNRAALRYIDLIRLEKNQPLEVVMDAAKLEYIAGSVSQADYAVLQNINRLQNILGNIPHAGILIALASEVGIAEIASELGEREEVITEYIHVGTEHLLRRLGISFHISVEEQYQKLAHYLVTGEGIQGENVEESENDIDKLAAEAAIPIEIQYVGRLFGQIRETRGIELAEIAERIWESPSKIEKFESGREYIDPNRIVIAAVASGIPFEEVKEIHQIARDLEALRGFAAVKDLDMNKVVQILQGRTSDEDFAEVVGINLQTLQGARSGKKNTIKVINKILDSVGISRYSKAAQLVYLLSSGIQPFSITEFTESISRRQLLYRRISRGELQRETAQSIDMSLASYLYSEKVDKRMQPEQIARLVGENNVFYDIMVARAEGRIITLSAEKWVELLNFAPRPLLFSEHLDQILYYQ